MRKIFAVMFLMAFAMISCTALVAQPMNAGNEDGFGPAQRPMNKQFDANDDMNMPPQARNKKGGNQWDQRNPRQGKKPMTPEMKKIREQREAMMAIAEAHKELARIYEDSGKIDAAAAELKKIIDLAVTASAKETNDKNDMKFMHKVIPVYTEIARLYLQHDKLSEAEKILNEGIAKFEKEDAKAATKLILHLGKIYKKSNNLEKAEETYKRVIKLNEEAIK